MEVRRLMVEGEIIPPQPIIRLGYELDTVGYKGNGSTRIAHNHSQILSGNDFYIPIVSQSNVSILYGMCDTYFTRAKGVLLCDEFMGDWNCVVGHLISFLSHYKHVSGDCVFRLILFSVINLVESVILPFLNITQHGLPISGATPCTPTEVGHMTSFRSSPGSSEPAVAIRTVARFVAVSYSIMIP